MNKKLRIEDIIFGQNIYYFWDNLNELVIIHDINLKILWANKVALKKFGVLLNDITEQYCYSVLYNKKMPCVNCPLLKSIASRDVQHTKFINPNKKTFIMHALPIKNKKENIVALIQFTKDITDYISAYKRNLYYNNLSHELKTPLNLIYTATKLLEKNLNDNNYLRYIDIIQNNYYRLFRMINNILDLTKIETGFYNLTLTQQDIVENIKQLSTAFKEYIENEGKSFKFTSKVKTKLVIYDSFDMERIILNLISNAIKFTEPGDKIVISLFENDKDNYLYISVKDTGIGIPEDQQKKIFESFNQAIKNHGTGLGLAIVKSLVELHNGKIGLKSTPGKGSEFIVKIPKNLTVNENNVPIDFGIDIVKQELSDIL